MNTAKVSGSIIIPAHNEAALIGDGLRALSQGLDPEYVEVVVVANGCSDDTVLVARSAYPAARVLDIPEASKPAALRAGEGVATRLPRLYVDADVRLSGTAALATLAVLSEGAVAARPPIQYDAGAATWPVRSYYRARSQMPSLLGHAWGAGVYGLSADARKRFDHFPDVVGDDLFIDRLLAPGELVVVDTEPVIVRTPRDTERLLRILRRGQQAKADEHAIEAKPTEADTVRDLMLVVRSRHRGFLDAAVYAWFAAIARIRRRSRPPRWERDDSTR